MNKDTFGRFLRTIEIRCNNSNVFYSSSILIPTIENYGKCLREIFFNLVFNNPKFCQRKKERKKERRKKKEKKNLVILDMNAIKVSTLIDSRFETARRCLLSTILKGNPSIMMRFSQSNRVLFFLRTKGENNEAEELPS
jgi:hypothetical protein